MCFVVFLFIVLFVVVLLVLVDESCVEVCGGVVWNLNDSDVIVGVVVGYDWDFGISIFVGVEVLVDKILIDNICVLFGFGGCLGVKVLELGKFYVVVSY